MGALTKEFIHKTRESGGRDAYVIKNGATLYYGTLVGTDANGYLDHWADASGMKFEGILINGRPAAWTAAAGGHVIGNTSASPKPEGHVDTSGVILKGVAVGSAVQGSVNALVYCSTNNPADFSLSGTSNVGAIGRVQRFISAGICDVALFTPQIYTQNVGLGAITPFTDNTGGTGTDTLAVGVGEYLLSIPINLATVADGDVLTALPIPHKFAILAVDAYVTQEVTTADKLTTLNVEITATNLTGGVVALTSANCATLGAKIAGSAVTAANTGAAAATISIEASSTTAFAEGEVMLVLTVKNMDTADALASLSDKAAEFINA